jgi:hypothetical protein
MVNKAKASKSVPRIVLGPVARWEGRWERNRYSTFNDDERV